MIFTKIKETCLYVEDLELILEFYTTKLSLPVISYVPGKHLFLRAGSSVLLFFNPLDSKEKKSPPAHFGGGKQHFAFEVQAKNYEAAKNEIRSIGITILEEVTWSSGEKSFYFEDPAGNVLEIVPDKRIWD
jgi:catechol 2,3-dioxygenase-like lactoylglutathione lyase family enzyme